MLGHYIFDPHNRSYVLCIVFVIKPRGRLPELGNPKSGRGRLRERFITKFKSQIKRGFSTVASMRPTEALASVKV